MKSCTICGSSENIDEHHTSYEPEETVFLCRSCHQLVHGSDSHYLKPDDHPGTTVIEITDEQRSYIKDMGYGSHKSAIQELIESYEQQSLTEDDVRRIADEVVTNRVTPKALEGRMR